MTKSCGFYYRQAFLQFGSDEAGQKAFAAGFVHGQAEKVFSGVCRGAMFRPSIKYRDWFGPVVQGAARLYGLDWDTLGNEFWIFPHSERWRFEVIEQTAKTGVVNDPHWHIVRATFCGIPNYLIDNEYHLREGATTPADT